MTASLQRARRIGPALDAHYRLILWLVPTLAGFPRSQKFLLGDWIQDIALAQQKWELNQQYKQQILNNMVQS